MEYMCDGKVILFLLGKDAGVINRFTSVDTMVKNGYNSSVPTVLIYLTKHP